MSELACTFDDFKKRSKELLDALPDLDHDGLDNGIKMLNLSYLNMTGTENERYQASIALQLVHKQIGTRRPDFSRR